MLVDAAKLERRVHYLSEMGLEQWFVRRTLPGAARSPEFGNVAPESQSAEQISTPANALPLAGQLTPEVVLPRETNSNLNKEKALVSVEADVSESETSSVRANNEALPQVECRLRAYLFDSIVVTTSAENDIPDPEEAKLLANILLATFRKEFQLNRTESFSWPLFSNNAIHQSLGVGLEAVLSLWQKQIVSDSAFAAHIHFGAVLADTDEFSVLESLSFAEKSKTFVIDHALHQLLANSQFKRSCWHQINQLRVCDALS